MSDPLLPSPTNFDDELTLQDLLSAVNSQRITDLLAKVLFDGYRICDVKNNTIYEHQTGKTLIPCDIAFDFELIGYLEASAQQQASTPIILEWLQLLFGCSQRYIMASSMHVESVRSDYETLNEEHQALLASEQRYRILSEQLDKKVKEQVGTLEQTWRKLYTAEKQASVGQLAAGIAHEINNPIGFVNSNLNTASKYLDDLVSLGQHIKAKASPETLLEYWTQKDLDFVFEDFTDLLNESKEGAKRVADIVADLKLFANLDSEEEITIDINRQLDVTCHMARTSMDESVKLSFTHDQPCFIKCRPAYIGQLMLGIIMNAADALKQKTKGDKTINISSQQDEKQLFIHIEDNGSGIPPEMLTKVFDPFFTTKQVGEGKGLGLTFCKDIIHGHGGSIDINSTLEQGTVVSIILPITPDKTPA